MSTNKTESQHAAKMHAIEREKHEASTLQAPLRAQAIQSQNIWTWNDFLVTKIHLSTTVQNRLGIRRDQHQDQTDQSQSELPPYRLDIIHMFF